MKKFLLSLVMLCLTCASVMAGSDIKVIDGDKKVFKTAKGEALLEIIWDGATYDDKMPLTDKFPDLKPYQEASWSGFQDSFNDECKKVKVIRNAQNPRYKFVIQVTKVDQYFNVMGWVSGNATKIWGTMTITDLETNTVLTTIKIKEVNGGASPSPTETFSDAFEELAEQVADLK